MTNTSEIQSQTEQVESAAQIESAEPRPSRRKSILALSVFALGLNATAAVYTLSPSEFALPNVNALAELPPQIRSTLADLLPQARSVLAELLPSEKASVPTPDPVVVALKDVQSAQQQHAALLQENSSALQRSTARLEHDSTVLLSLRQSLTDEQSDIKKISNQLSTLMAKVDSLQNAIAPEVTSSISKGRAHNRQSAMTYKRWVRSSKPEGPVSVGGAPLSIAPAQARAALQSPES